jgi:peptidyl-prolyl cis-trans isomerase C
MSRFQALRVFLVVLPVALAAGACSKTSPASQERKLASASPAPGSASAAPTGTAAPAPAQPEAPPVKPVPAQLPDVLARVNGEPISKADFERALKNIEQRAGGPIPAARRDEVYRGLIDQLVGLRLLRQEVITRKVAVTDAEVNQRVEAIKQQFGSEEQFKDALKAQNVTLDRLRADQRSDLAVSKLLDNELKDKVTASPDQVITFYRQNTDKFKQTERVRASHILLTVPQNADAATKAKIKAQAEAVLKEVKAGKDFAALAKEHSQDPGSAINGGDLGYFQPGQMVGPFNDVAFKLAPGQVSDLVETQFGFHIIKVVDKQPGRTVPFDEVKDQVKQYLENMNKQRETTAFVASLRAKGKVEVLV